MLNRAALLSDKAEIDFVQYAKLKYIIVQLGEYRYVCGHSPDGPKRLGVFADQADAEMFRVALIERLSGQDWQASLLADTTGEAPA